MLKKKLETATAVDLVVRGWRGDLPGRFTGVCADILSCLEASYPFLNQRDLSGRMDGL